MKSDVEILQDSKINPIVELTKGKLDILARELELYESYYKAKVSL